MRHPLYDVPLMDITEEQRRKFYDILAASLGADTAKRNFSINFIEKNMEDIRQGREARFKRTSTTLHVYFLVLGEPGMLVGKPPGMEA